MAKAKRASRIPPTTPKFERSQHASGRNGATSKSATLEAKLDRFVVREEARGAYRHFRDPAKGVAELHKRAQEKAISRRS